MEVGHDQPRDQTDRLDRSPVLRQVQQGQARPMGVRRPHQRRLSCTASAGPTSSATRSSATGHHLMTPNWPTTGPGDGAKRPCRSTSPPNGSTGPGRALRDLQEHAARRRGPATNPTPVGDMARHRPQDDRRRLGTSARRTRLNPVSSTSTATPASHQGLLEPDARKRARPVLKGARRRKAPGLRKEQRALAQVELTRVALSAEKQKRDKPHLALLLCRSVGGSGRLPPRPIAEPKEQSDRRLCRCEPGVARFS